MRYLITGATGFVGGHIAEACAARGHALSAIVRPQSNATFLEKLGATLHRGELTDAKLVAQALDGVDVAVHCAAKVGDRGPIEEYRPVNVGALRCLLEACKGRPLRRFIQMSSLGVYEARHHYGTDENEPLPAEHLDSYSQTKMEAEQVVREYQQKHGVPVVILRPGFVYGPRDRTVLPKLIRKMSTGKIHYLGGDRRALNTIYIGNLIEAVFLAAERPQAVGQAYNLTDGEPVSKRRFFEAVADGMGLKRSKQILPRPVAACVVWLLHKHIVRATRAGRKPLLPHAQYKFLLLNLDFSIEKAKRELGYQPRYNFEEGMKETVNWYRDHNGEW